MFFLYFFINFENDANKTKMHIFKTSLTPHAIKRKEQGLWYFATPEYKACEHLHNIKNENFFSGLKEKAKELADTEGEQQAICRYPFRIRHENKYYSYPR